MISKFKKIVDPEAVFAERVGIALMKSFCGDDEDPEIPFTYLPEFTKRVLDETQKIPNGKVVTYGEIVDRIGSPDGSRTEENALSRNSLPLIIPCHRVLNYHGI